MRPRRSMLFIPGANAAMLSTSFVYGADAVIFDLEDAVALREKDTARLLVHHAKTMCWSWKRRSNGSNVNVDARSAVPG